MRGRELTRTKQIELVIKDEGGKVIGEDSYGNISPNQGLGLPHPPSRTRRRHSVSSSANTSAV
jgi:hypothetical protein